MTSLSWVSGYGASIAASRCARAGQRVCVLEKGKEWLPGDFPETFGEASSYLHINESNHSDIKGKGIFKIIKIRIFAYWKSPIKRPTFI